MTDPLVEGRKLLAALEVTEDLRGSGFDIERAAVHAWHEWLWAYGDALLDVAEAARGMDALRDEPMSIDNYRPLVEAFAELHEKLAVLFLVEPQGTKEHAATCPAGEGEAGG